MNFYRLYRYANFFGNVFRRIATVQQAQYLQFTRGKTVYVRRLLIAFTCLPGHYGLNFLTNIDIPLNHFFDGIDHFVAG